MFRQIDGHASEIDLHVSGIDSHVSEIDFHVSEIDFHVSAIDFDVSTSAEKYVNHRMYYLFWIIGDIFQQQKCLGRQWNSAYLST